jgi:hypothetical protein
MIGKDMLTEIACLISSEDLKLNFIKARWRGCLPFKEAWFAGIIQIEFL